MTWLMSQAEIIVIQNQMNEENNVQKRERKKRENTRGTNIIFHDFVLTSLYTHGHFLLIFMQ